MKITLLFLLAVTFEAFALDEFSAEGRFAHQAPIPPSVFSDVKGESNLEDCGFSENNISKALEATEVLIGDSNPAILVKPKSWCLCGAYYCPIWLYQLNNKSATRIWSTPGTSGIDILDHKTQGYRDIKESGGTAGHSYYRIWVWNGMKYKVRKEKYTTAGDVK